MMNARGARAVRYNMPRPMLCKIRLRTEALVAICCTGCINDPAWEDTGVFFRDNFGKRFFGASNHNSLGDQRFVRAARAINTLRTTVLMANSRLSALWGTWATV